MNLVEDKKAENIVLLDLRPDAIIADFFVICTCTSDRQIRALQENLYTGIKETYGKTPLSNEGKPESGWVLMDYGDLIIHLFTREQREFYDLEGFWARASNVLISIQ